jgi:MATE family multidrug resistance protein
MLPIMMWGYIYYRKLHKRTWFGWSREMFDKKRLATYLKFGISGGLMVLFEVVGFEMTTLTASLLVSPVELNAHSIAFNSLLVSFTVPLALSIATSTRVGQFLGEGKPERAKYSGRTGAIIVVGNRKISSSFNLKLSCLSMDF